MISYLFLTIVACKTSTQNKDTGYYLPVPEPAAPAEPSTPSETDSIDTGVTDTSDSGDTGETIDTADTTDTTDTGEFVIPEDAVADFNLTDSNPFSPSHGQSVSPRDHLHTVSGWYFIKAT